MMKRAMIKVIEVFNNQVAIRIMVIKAQRAAIIEWEGPSVAGELETYGILPIKRIIQQSQATVAAP